PLLEPRGHWQVPVKTTRRNRPAPCRLAPGRTLAPLALGRVYGQRCRILASLEFLALLPIAAADRTFLFDTEAGDAAARAGDRLAAHEYAHRHAKDGNQHEREYQQPGHGWISSPVSGPVASPKRLPKAVLGRTSNASPARLTNSAAMPCSSANASPRSGPRTISTVDRPSARSAEGSTTVTAARLCSTGAPLRGSRVCE